MSRVILLCADHPLPLYDSQTRRADFLRGVRYEEDGFSVQPHVYYRPAVDDLELPMKPPTAMSWACVLRRRTLPCCGTICGRAAPPVSRWSCGTCGWGMPGPGPSVWRGRWRIRTPTPWRSC